MLYTAALLLTQFVYSLSHQLSGPPSLAQTCLVQDLISRGACRSFVVGGKVSHFSNTRLQYLQSDTFFSAELVVFSVLCFTASVCGRDQGDEVLSEKGASIISSLIDQPLLALTDEGIRMYWICVLCIHKIACMKRNFTLVQFVAFAKGSLARYHTFLTHSFLY